MGPKVKYNEKQHTMSGLARMVQGGQVRLHINVNNWPWYNAMLRVHKVASDVAMRGSINKPVIVTLVLYDDLHNSVSMNEGTTYHR